MQHTTKKKKPSVLFSVVVPTCQRNKTLADCLQQLTPGVQTLSEDLYEVIVTDDGKGDSNAESLIRDTFPWVTWVAGPHRGPAANRNTGTKYAQGEWLIFTDDDCLPTPGWLQAYAEAVASGQDAKHVFEGRTLCEMGLAHPLDHAPINLSGGYLWSCNMAIRRRTFAEVGGFDEDFPIAHMEDADLRERLKRCHIPFYFVADAVVNHPPKRFTWRSAFGPYAESEVMYRYKQGEPGPHATRLLNQIIRFRVLWFLRATRTPCALLPIALISVREIGYVLLHAASWDRKYRTRFGPPTTPL